MAKMEAHSGPNKLLGNRRINPVTVMDKKLSTGMDCKISIAGIMICSARRFLAAQSPIMNVKMIEKNNAINIRNTVRNA